MIGLKEMLHFSRIIFSLKKCQNSKIEKIAISDGKGIRNRFEKKLKMTNAMSR
jgi:hypothetical protein